MWATASPMKVAAARGYGATVDTEAPDIPAAFERLEELQAETGRTLVHPYDDPLVMAGQGTVGLELVEDVPDVDVVLVPVGGGGLVSGIATAVKGLRPEARVVAIEPERSRRAAREPAGRGARHGPGSLDRPTGSTGRMPAPTASRSARTSASSRRSSTEDALEDAFRFLYGRAKLACELAGAATTAALLSGAVRLERGQTAVAVISGGNVAPETAAAILARR